MSVSNTSRSCCSFCKWIISICLLSLTAPELLLAQDAVRPSLAGEAASEARHEDVDRIPYNLLLGPVRFRVGASIGVEYNDNINYAEDGTAIVHAPTGDIVLATHAEEDVIIRPQI